MYEYIEVVDKIEGYDPSYIPIFHSSWSDWEEGGFVYIFEKDNKFYTIEGGHCVMVEDNSTVWDRDLCEISEDDAIQVMIEWEEKEFK